MITGQTPTTNRLTLNHSIIRATYIKIQADLDLASDRLRKAYRYHNNKEIMSARTAYYSKYEEIVNLGKKMAIREHTNDNVYGLVEQAILIENVPIGKQQPIEQQQPAKMERHVMNYATFRAKYIKIQTELDEASVKLRSAYRKHNKEDIMSARIAYESKYEEILELGKNMTSRMINIKQESNALTTVIKPSSEGILKELGVILGQVVGVLIGGTIWALGEVTNSDFIREVAEGVYKNTARTGVMLGSLASGTYDAVGGVITGDKDQFNQGLEEVLYTLGNSAKSIGSGFIHVTSKAIGTAGAIIEGDTDRALSLGKDLAKIAAIGVLTVGIIDLIDGIDGIDATTEVSDSIEVDDVPVGVESDAIAIDNPNVHYVTPHPRTLPDGTEIYIDGDGDTSINTGGGWSQHNPDYKTKA